MKKHTIWVNYIRGGVVLLIFSLLFSCQKDTYVQHFDDVFDTSGMDELNAMLESAETLEDVSAVFENVNISVPEGLKDISLDEMIEHYENNMKLSPEEIDMLLKNDSRTYIDVINRLGSLPDKLSDMVIPGESLKSGSLDGSNELKSSPLNKYLVKQKTQTSNFYSNDYYSAVKAYQNFIACWIIKTLKNINRLKSNQGNGNNGNHQNPDPDAYVVLTILITSNNNWDIWWAYWSDGSRTKHKGAAGSYVPVP